MKSPAQQILAATDFSDNADAALAVAVQSARALHAGLHVLHVFAPGEIDVTQLLADAVAKAAPDVPVTVAATGGDPAQEILRYAARHPIDLVVLGTHGRTGLSRILLGSVAERVLRGARCPVLVVPAASVETAPAASHAGVGAEDVEAPAPRRCLVCATPTQDLICEPCRARIRGEAPRRGGDAHARDAGAGHRGARRLARRRRGGSGFRLQGSGGGRRHRPPSRHLAASSR